MSSRRTARLLATSLAVTALTASALPLAARAAPAPDHRHRPDWTGAAQRFLAQRGIASSADLRAGSTTTVHGTIVKRFDQEYAGIPVVGAQYVVRLRDRAGEPVVTGGNGKVLGNLDIDLSNGLSADFARVIAQRALADELPGATIVDHGQAILPLGKGVLTRHLTARGWSRDGRLVQRELYLTAGSTRPVLSYDSIDSADGPVATTGHGFHGDDLPVDAYLSGTTYQLRDQSKPMYAEDGGEIRTYDARGADMNQALDQDGSVAGDVPLASSPTAPFDSAFNKYGAVDAHWGASKVYDYYRNLGRDSLDGKGGTINSLVGITAEGRPFPNAFWDGKAMVYGTGGQGFKPFSSSLDVVGHEMTHGVVEHTANLMGLGQSGALNEGLADYFGNAIENGVLGIPTSSPASGLMGEDLCTTTAGAECALRNLNKLRTTRQYDGEVHDDSTIASGAFWDTREILGDTLGDRVIYDLMSQYLTPASTFLDARRFTVAAARAAGASDDQIARITEAFAKRGISPGWEKRDLGLDSRVLRKGLTLWGPDAIDLAGGRYVVADNGSQGMANGRILSGHVDGHGPRVISPNPDRTYSFPSTDGDTDAWASATRSGSRVAIQTHDVDTGKIRTLATYRNAMVIETAVSGRTVAWIAFVRGEVRLYVHRPNGRIVQLAMPKSLELGSVRVRDDQVVYTATSSFMDPEQRGQLLSYDARTGKSSALTQVARWIGRPTITSRYIVFSEDQYQGYKTGVVRVDRDGSHRKLLVREISRFAGAFSGVTASSRWVTYDDGFGGPLRQVPISGGWNQRVSCSIGAQLAPLASRDRRVAWIDFTTGRMNLVTRATPRGQCPM